MAWPSASRWTRSEQPVVQSRGRCWWSRPARDGRGRGRARGRRRRGVARVRSSLDRCGRGGGCRARGACSCGGLARHFRGVDGAEEEEAFGEFAGEEEWESEWERRDEEQNDRGKSEEIAGEDGAGERAALEARGDGSGGKSAGLGTGCRGSERLNRRRLWPRCPQRSEKSPQQGSQLASGGTRHHAPPAPARRPAATPPARRRRP